MKEKNINILITSAGRRGALVNCFKETISRIKGIGGKVVSVDASPLAAALYISDNHYIVPSIFSSNYIETLLDICKKEDIKLIIPTIDTELSILSQSKKKFEENGIIVSISDPKIIEICRNKLKTFQFFKENNIPTVETFSYCQVDKIEKLNYPLFIKPCSGSASINTYKINNKKELDFFINYINNPVIQEYAEGKEFTMDILADFNGKVLNVVPRERIEIRAGEINKGKTVKEERLIEYGKIIIEKLGGVGPLTIQCFVNGKNVKFTEINPRFGGGYPLSFAAGANYPELLIRMVLGEMVIPRLGEFEENLIMLRWEDAVFIKEDYLDLNRG
ncbi:MAG: ATP-grasp domain-containing protein [Caldisericia bacterium]|nr:ATP-grasp domain-containing protein [Caldisericia bacterium]